MINQKGQSLIETLVALGAAVLIISAITVAVITAVSNSDFAKYQNLATGYAQQGIQVVEQKSQLDWDSIATYDGRFCLPQMTTVIYPPEAPSCSSINVANMFARDITFKKESPCNAPDANSPCCVPSTLPGSSDPQFCANNPAACSSQVTVAVKWTDGKCTAEPGSTNYFCHNVTLNSCITDINRTQ